MKIKPVTFRCSDAQLKRIEAGMTALKNDNRTDFLTKALEEFLDFAEKERIRELDLFSLVERVDKIGSRRRFSRNA